MSALRPLTALAVVLCAALLGWGCGGSSRRSPESYAGAVCTSVGGWLRDIQSQGQAVTASRVRSAADGKRVLRTFTTAVGADTDRALRSLRAAGVPDVPDGSHIAATFVSAFARARQVFGALDRQVAALPANDPAAFRAGAVRLGQSVQSSLVSVVQSLSGLKSPALQQAGKRTAACRSLPSA